MDIYMTVNDVLVNLFNEIWKLEEKAIIRDEFTDISINDMHIIEAIGLGEGSNMSSIAKKLGITVGSLTISMNGLVQKEYVERVRSETDRRIVNIRLMEKGERAYRQHAAFHMEMAETALAALSEEEKEILAGNLKRLLGFFRSYEV